MADFTLSIGVDINQSYREMSAGISSLVAQINSDPPKIKVQFDNKSLESMRKQIEMLQNSYTKNAAGGSIILPSTLTATLQQEAKAKQSAADAAMKKAAADKEAAKAQREVEKEAARANVTLNKANALLAQATQNTHKWTKARAGKSRGAYDEYANQTAELRALINQYNNGAVSAKEFAKRADEIQNSLKSNESIIKQNGEATQTFINRVANLSQKFATWFGITRIVMAGAQSIKKMANATIELDTAMTELKKVTNETDATYNKFLSTAAERAKNLGASLTDTVSATADFARLGFSLEEASNLADAATVYKNVGDGITDISTASESVIATMQAFGIEASDAMTIVDRFNEVGNNFAISSGGIGDALLRSASAMHAAGNTIDETIALVTAANTVVQNPESVGTTMKTISMYLRAAKTEAEDAGESTDGMASSVSELRSEILALTGNEVDIQIDENTFKSTYQIIKELAGVWDKLTDVSKANILEMIGGKRNANVTASLIENFELAEKVVKKSAGSAGSALEENEKYLDSINGKMNALNASFQEMSSNFISSDFIKGTVDALRILVELLNSVASTFGSIPTALVTGAFTKFIFTAAKTGANLKSLEDITLALEYAFPKLTPIITSVTSAIAKSGTVAEGASAGFTALAGAIGVSATTLGTFLGIAAGIAAVVIAVDFFTESFDEAQERAKESAEAYNQAASEVESLQNELDTTRQRIEELKAQGTLSVVEQEELNKLESQNKQLENQLAIKQKLAQYQQTQAAKDANDVLTKEYSYQTGGTAQRNSYATPNDYATPVYTNGDIIDKASAKQKQLNEKQEEYNNLLERQSELTPEYSKWWQSDTEYEKNAKKIKSLKDEIDTLNGELSGDLSEISSQYSSLFDSDGNVIAGYEDTVARVDTLIGNVTDSTNEATDAQNNNATAAENTKTSVEELSNSLTGLATYQETLNSAMESSVSATGLTSEEITKLKNEYKDLDGFDAGKLFETTANGVHLNQKALRELNAQYEAQKELEFANTLEELGNEYDDLTEKIKNCKEGSDEYNSLVEERNGISDQIEQVSLLASEFDGLTSSYNKWLQAQSSTNEGDMYDNVASGLDDLKELYEDGLVGTDDFRTGVDFMTYKDMSTASVDELIAAYEKSRKVMNRYFTEGQDGCLNFLNKLEELKGATKNKDGSWDIDFDDDKIAKKLGISVEAVQAIMRKLSDYGFDINLDSTTKDIEDLKEKIKSTESALKEIGQEPIDINVNAEDIDGEITKAKNKINEINNSDVEADVKTAQLEDANAKLDTLIAKKIKASNPSFMSIDTSSVNASIVDALTALKEYQTAANKLTTLELKGADASEIEEAKSKVDELAGKIQNLDSDTKVSIGLEADGSIESIKEQIKNNEINISVSADTSKATTDIANIEGEEVKVDVVTSGNKAIDRLKSALKNIKDETVNIKVDISEAVETINGLVSIIKGFINGKFSGKVKWTNDKSEVDSYSAAEKKSKGIVNWTNDESIVDYFKEKNHTATGTVNWGNNTENVKRSFTATGTVKWDDSRADGTAHAQGAAFARGSWGTKESGLALGGEVGQELVVRNGKFFTIGDNGAELFNYKKDDIIFNAGQTAQIFKYGKIKNGKKRGEVFAQGTAFAEGTAFSSGSGKFTSGGDTVTKPSSKNKNKTSTKSSSKNKTSSTDDIEVIDWIEIAIERIERAIKRLSTAASSSFKKLSTRISKTDKQISKVNEEIALQEQARQEYLDKAADVNLSSGLKKKVREGTIDISEYSDKTAELIKEYQEWYEKALDCSDAIQELHENVAELYQEEFNLVATDFDNQLSLLEHMSNTFENGLDGLEENGMLASTKYYEALRDTEEEKLKVQQDALDALILKMSEAMALGEIEEGSEAWYEMQQQINDTKESIQESENAIDEFNNSIRETEWSHFDYLQERISSITSEADFLIELMSNSDLFSDNGKLSDTGQATMGLHAQNYNVYMAQADKYAEEIKKLNQDLANDPNNTILIERREELLGLQRESILSAEDEKQALIELAEEGINKELEAMQELTESYKNALDEAKDLYDYQKRIKDKTSEVAKLRKQLSAYENDDSEETKAVKQRLEVSLKDAEESLEEAQYERYISEQKKLIDNLYSEYELILNERLDNVDALLTDIIAATNESAGVIKETLEAQSAAVGYTLSESMNDIWSNEGGATAVVSKYGESFTTQLTSINAVLNAIAEKIGASIEESDEEAEDVIDNTTPSTDPIPIDTPKEPEKPKEQEKPKNIIKKGGKINAKGAKIYDYKGDKSGERQYFRKDPIYKVLKIDGNWIKVRHHKLKNGVTGWFKKSDVKAYKTGGLVDYTGLAWVDGKKKKPEAFLSADDTKMFMSLRDALKEAKNGNMSIPNIFANEQYGFDMDGIVDKMSKYNELQSDSVRDIFYEINIPIEHVSDYNDFMNQLRNDDKFEKFIQSMTTDRLVGGSKLAKNKYKW